MTKKCDNLVSFLLNIFFYHGPMNAKKKNPCDACDPLYI